MEDAGNMFLSPSHVQISWQFQCDLQGFGEDTLPSCHEGQWLIHGAPNSTKLDQLNPTVSIWVQWACLWIAQDEFILFPLSEPHEFLVVLYIIWMQPVAWYIKWNVSQCCWIYINLGKEPLENVWKRRKSVTAHGFLLVREPSLEPCPVITISRVFS